MKKTETLELVSKLRELNFFDGQPRELAHPRRQGVSIELRVINPDNVVHLNAFESARLGPQLQQMLISCKYVLAVIVKKEEWCDVVYRPLTGKEKTLQILDTAVLATNSFLDSKNCLQIEDKVVKTVSER